MTVEEIRDNLLRRIDNNESELSNVEYLIIENDEEIFTKFFKKVAKGEIPFTDDMYSLLNYHIELLQFNKTLTKEEKEELVICLVKKYFAQGEFEMDVAIAISEELELDDNVTHRIQELADAYLNDPKSTFAKATPSDTLVKKLMELHRYDVIENFKGPRVNGYTPSEGTYNYLIKEWPYETKPFIVIKYEQENNIYKYDETCSYKELIMKYDSIVDKLNTSSLTNAYHHGQLNKDDLNEQAFKIRRVIRKKIITHSDLEELHTNPKIAEKLFDNFYDDTNNMEVFPKEEQKEIALELFNCNVIYHSILLYNLNAVTKEQVLEKIDYCLKQHYYIDPRVLEVFGYPFLKDPNMIKLLVDYGKLERVLDADYYLHYTEAKDNRSLVELLPTILESLQNNPINEHYLTDINYRIIQYPELARSIIALGKVTRIDTGATGFNNEIIDIVKEAAIINKDLTLTFSNDNDNKKLARALMNLDCYQVFFTSNLGTYLSDEEYFGFIRSHLDNIEFVDRLIYSRFTDIKYLQPEIINDLLGMPYITEQILSHIEYEAADNSFISQEALHRMLTYFAKKKKANERNLIKIADHLGINIIKYLENTELFKIVNIPEEELDKILALLPKSEYTMRDVEAAHESLIQFLFNKTHDEDVNIFSEFIHAYTDKDIKRLNYLKQKLFVNISIDNLFEILNQYNIYDINTVDELLDLIISKLDGPERENYLEILHDLTDIYITDARDYFHNNHYFDEQHGTFARLFDEVVYYIDNDEEYQLDNTLRSIARQLDDKFYKDFNYNKNLPEECENPVYLLKFLAAKIKDPAKRNKYLPFLKEAINYFHDKMKERYAKELTLGEELDLPFKNEPRNTRSAIVKFYITKCHLFETETGELLQDVIFSSLEREGLSPSLIKDCINYYGGVNNYANNIEDIKKNVGIVVKVATKIINSHKIYNQKGEEPDESVLIASFNNKHELKRIYYVGPPKIDPYQILLSLNIPLIRKNLLNNEAMYNKLLEIMKKRKLHLIPNNFDTMLMGCGISSDYYTIASFINYFTPIYESERKRMVAIGKDPDDALSALTSILIQAETYGSASGVYSQILGPEDARLIRANPEPFSANQFEGNSRLVEAVELTKKCFTRQEITIPTFDKIFNLSSGKRLNVIVGNLTAPCNLTHGERTGACMRIGGVADSLLRFCIENPNGFFIRLEDPKTHEYISRVSGYRNGNTIFLNQIRNSCNPELYDDEDVIDACKQAVELLIDLTENSLCPIENVVVNRKYAMEGHASEEVYLNIRDNKEGLPRFYSDIDSCGIVLATSAYDGAFAPIDLDNGDVPRYQMCRTKVTFTYNEEELITKINRVASVKAILNGIDYEEITPMEFPDGIVYGMVTDDWYIYVTKQSEVIYDYINIDPRAKEEVESNLLIVDQMLDKQEVKEEVKHGI